MDAVYACAGERGLRGGAEARVLRSRRLAWMAIFIAMTEDGLSNRHLVASVAFQMRSTGASAAAL